MKYLPLPAAAAITEVMDLALALEPVKTAPVLRMVVHALRVTAVAAWPLETLLEPRETRSGCTALVNGFCLLAIVCFWETACILSVSTVRCYSGKK